ncbi:hypothetical protein SFV1gp49 [Sulfolobus filamentous virus 1]|uniref:Uncharacterized protein n=1 Tax=Sulfolobus filamentous virus 1 TaxID=2304198 RepID=A0A346LU88_SUFV1|nr:hypothetical protein HOT91_gp49 [Sulfolobus filamentous virus 1]AXQ00131.1 hypothetical protein SFV1gp49 [Sulfolobus filamentous virus 1]
MSDKMPVTTDFINLAEQLTLNGYKSTSAYVQGLQVQSTFYIVLLNNGNVVAQLPVSQFKYNEISQNEQALIYTAIDSSSNTYTFNEVQLWAGNQYIITDDILQQSVTKNPGISVTVNVAIELSIETNTYQGTINITRITPVGPVKTPIPAYSFWLYVSGNCHAISTPIFIVNYIILTLLIPTSFYNNIQNTLFMQTYNQLNVPINEFNGISLIAVALPSAIINIANRLIPQSVSYQCTTLPPNTPFKPSTTYSSTLVGAFMDMGGIKVQVITILNKQLLATTNYYIFQIVVIQNE